MADVSVLNKVESSIYLPPGFRFHPTDEEIITHYVSPKVVNPSFSATAVGEVDLNKCEPWDLPSKANMGEKEWYFFYQKDRKYPTGMRTNRATEAGYWKATGKDKEIFRGKGVLVGMKKTLVFYRGRAPKGEKTNWVMHEFRLEGITPHINLPRTSKDEWVVCRVFHKNMAMKKSSILEYLPDSPTLPPLMDPPFLNSNTRQGLSYVNNMVGLEELQDHNKRFLPNFSGFNHQVSQCNPPPSSALYTRLPDPFPNFPLSALAATNGASIAMRRNCKMEEFSNQSMVSASQDTGLSNDRNMEISSYDSIEIPTSAVQILDLDNIWKY